MRIRYLNFSREPDARADPAEYDGMVVLGGPMSAYDNDRYPHLDTEIQMLETALDRAMPILGICLGRQLLARALGARVRRNHTTEIGWCDIRPTEQGASDPLIRHFGPRERIFQWHGDTFDIPRGAVHLASSPDCVNQAFRFGDRAFGLQFHLEADEALIERWLTVPQHRHELESVNGRGAPERIRAENTLCCREVQGAGRASFRLVRGAVPHAGEAQDVAVALSVVVLPAERRMERSSVR